MKLLASGRKIGYLLKSRVIDVADFVDSLERIARGGSVVDPALVNELVSRRRQDPLAVLSTREREVLALMAEGRPMWASDGNCGWPKAPSRSMCATFSTNSTCLKPPTTTAGSAR